MIANLCGLSAASVPAWIVSRPWLAVWSQCLNKSHSIPHAQCPCVLHVAGWFAEAEVGSCFHCPFCPFSGPPVLQVSFFRGFSKFFPSRGTFSSCSLLGALLLILFVIHTNAVSSWTTEAPESWAPGEPQVVLTHRLLPQRWCKSGSRPHSILTGTWVSPLCLVSLFIFNA